MERTQKFSVMEGVKVGESAVIYDQVNLFRCSIGKGTKIDAFVYIEEGVVIGNNCKIRAFSFLPTGTEIGNQVFVGPRVTFTNDKYPSVGNELRLEKTVVEDNVSIGAGVIVLPGVTIGKGSLIGAGSIVTKDVPINSKVIGRKIGEYKRIP